jgi:hypothetical protein
MTNYYAVTRDLSAEELETAVELIETSATFTVVPYRESCQTLFLLIEPACNAVYTP